MDDYEINVFINCPFDTGYVNLFRAIVFTIHNCGFIARCALEAGNAGGVRIEKINRIIEQCKYGIHDISIIEITAESPYPRLNMPYELGVFMGCKHFGGRLHKKKDFLVLDAVAHRYKIMVSDLAGYDFPAHNNDVNTTIGIIRDWLAQASGKAIPGPAFQQKRYAEFLLDLPELCETYGLDINNIPFSEYYSMITAWIIYKNEELLDTED